MEERIQEIINRGKENVEIAEETVSDLRNRIRFYQGHSLAEEERSTRVKLLSLQPVVHEYSQTLKELQDMLNAWNS